jgi:hypothetical protein
MYRSFSGMVLLLICGLLFFLGFPLWGEDFIEPFVMPSARASAMGGNHAAYTDDFYALFTNPAAFVEIEGEFSAAELSLSIYGPFFEIFDAAQAVSNSPASLDLSGIVGPGGFGAGFDFGGPLSWGWAGRGFALGLFNRTRSDAFMSGSMVRPQFSEDIFFLSGCSFRILDKQGHILDAGLLGKFFFRGTLDMKASLSNIISLGDNPLQHPFATYVGLGFDLGLRYNFARNFTAALVYYDAYSPVWAAKYNTYSDFLHKNGTAGDGHSRVQPRLNFGLQYQIRPSLLSKYVSRLVIAADYRDFLDLASLIPRHPILNAGIGMEIILLEVLSVRAGIADGLPSAGFGLNLSFARLDFAMYGKELGLDPGIQPVYAAAFSLLFRY